MGAEMAKSIIQQEKECFFCGAVVDLERHHIFAGTANRKVSEKYGLTVWLCHRHHTGTDGAQYDKDKNLWLKEEAQKAFESIYSHDEWMRVIGRNYL